MKLPFHQLYLLLILFTFFGCAKEIISISVLEPAEVIIPHEIERLSIFPLAGPPDSIGQFTGLKHFPLGKNLDYNFAKLGYVYGIYDVLVESPRFQRVVIADSTYLDSLLAGSMNMGHLRNLCRIDSTDALLLIKLVEASDMLDHIEGEFSVHKELNYFSNVRLSIYQPGLPKGDLDYSFQNIMYYDSYKTLYPEWAFKILRRMCYLDGNKIGKNLAPSWSDDQERILMKGMNTDLKLAVRKAVKGQWEEAAVIWNELSESNLNRLAAKASYNMAVAWEQADDLQQALYWLNHADSLHHKKAFDKYESLLLKRIEIKTTIDIQMPEN
jgi:hypothetical protein